MLARDVDPVKTRSIVEYSSGSTVISLALVSRVNHGINDIRAYLSNKTTKPKIMLMQFFGLDMYGISTHGLILANLIRTLFGGPSQPEPRDMRSGIQRARMMGQHDEAFLSVDQYENDAVS